MALTDKQRGQLNRAPASAHVRTRERRGKEFCYLEAWRAIEAANRIFGPDGWDRETVEMRCAATKQNGATLTAAYVAKVRVTVHAEGRAIVREGQGCGEGRGDTPFEAHDMGLKAAETDATKRALATFGRALGLGFYLGERPRARSASKKAAAKAGQAGGSSSEDEADAKQENCPVAESGPAVSASPETSEGGAALAGDEAGSPDEDRAAYTGARRPSSAGAGAPPCTTSLPVREAPEASAMLIPKERRVRNKDHLRFVASQPCLVCDRKPADAHHLRFAQPTAMAKKVSDEFTVPLCRAHHRQLHRDPDERGWWEAQGIEPMDVAEELWREASRTGT